ncbi:MAG TPA: DegQ family serine endoprotease [Aquella sp.]|nr:DegQ family serine endoprotease [Aquella sp.]
MAKKLLLTILSSILLVSACTKPEVSSNEPPIAVNKEITPPVEKTQMELPNFSNLVKLVGNTVVNITTEAMQEATVDNQDDGSEPDDPLSELFKRMIPQQAPAQPQVRHSLGSGFIISADGYILTNAHVVNGAKKITVKTSDKQELDAKLIGLDTKTDIALLKVNANNLPMVKIGDPNQLEVGEWVAAMGAPFGFDNSVTQGIVSAKGRNLPSDNYVPFIQTDVPINPGNSGGPLFNLRAQVVGMNSQIYSRSGGYMGISFSIPIDIAMNIVNQLKQYGKVSHGQLGVQFQPVTKQLAKSFGLSKPAGALVANIVPGSGAEKAGIKVGDIILKADGKSLDDVGALPLIVGSKKPGDKISLEVFRNSKTMTIDAVLSGTDDALLAQNGKPESSKSLQLDKFGLSLSDIDARTREKMRLGVGVIVTKAVDLAQMSGILAGDVILSINNVPVSSVARVKDIVGNNTAVVLLISRNNQQMFITLG